MRGVGLHLCLQDDSVILDEVLVGIHDVLGRQRERGERDGGRGGERGKVYDSKVDSQLLISNLSGIMHRY
jgi:hypothetical protein